MDVENDRECLMVVVCRNDWLKAIGDLMSEAEKSVYMLDLKARDKGIGYSRRVY